MTAPWVIIPQDPTPEDANPQGVPVRYDEFVRKLFKYQTPDVMKLHAGVGLCEESGELAGCIKKNAVYHKDLMEKMKEDGKTLKEHIVEEAGDVLFYLQACLNQYDLDFQDVLQYNAIKLSERYKGLKYSDKAANARADKPQNGTEGAAT